MISRLNLVAIALYCSPVPESLVSTNLRPRRKRRLRLCMCVLISSSRRGPALCPEPGRWRPHPSPHKAGAPDKREMATQHAEGCCCAILGVLWIQSRRTNTVSQVQENFSEKLMVLNSEPTLSRVPSMNVRGAVPRCLFAGCSSGFMDLFFLPSDPWNSHLHWGSRGRPSLYEFTLSRGEVLTVVVCTLLLFSRGRHD